MIFKKLHIKGFRNFADTWLYFADKSLIIGKNDVGKSNLLYALRILFDKKLSILDLELTDSDFNVYTNAETIEITAYLEDVVEDCLVGESSFKGHISPTNSIVLRYYKDKDEDGYKILVGQDDVNLEEIGDRRYIKRLYMHYVDSQRDLLSFYKSEKRKLLQTSIDRLNDDELEEDEKGKESLKTDLSSLNDKINSLNYISNALSGVNDVLRSISTAYSDTQVRFTSVEQDVDKMLDKVDITSFTSTGDVAMGGDGRNNQIYLATWLTQRQLEKDESSVVLFAIEEPESHLHPHQQRILADYFMGFNQGQIFLTSHSPQILARINPGYLIKLTEIENNVVATCGVNSNIKEMFDAFNYRLNPISSELFYSDGALLVEGESEVILYRALSNSIEQSQDSLNYSIISVGGIGFKPYIKLCKSLNIPFVIKTDNDIFALKDGCNRFIGLDRAVGMLEDVTDSDESKTVTAEYQKHSNLFVWDADSECSSEGAEKAIKIKKSLKMFGIFLSDDDLENDLASSEIYEDLKNFYRVDSKDLLVKEMKRRKAENMFAFVNAVDGKTVFSKLKAESIVGPLNALTTVLLGKKHTNE